MTYERGSCSTTLLGFAFQRLLWISFGHTCHRGGHAACAFFLFVSPSCSPFSILVIVGSWLGASRASSLFVVVGWWSWTCGGFCGHLLYLALFLCLSIQHCFSRGVCFTDLIIFLGIIFLKMLLLGILFPSNMFGKYLWFTGMFLILKRKILNR